MNFRFDHNWNTSIFLKNSLHNRTLIATYTALEANNEQNSESICFILTASVLGLLCSIVIHVSSGVNIYLHNMFLDNSVCCPNDCARQQKLKFCFCICRLKSPSHAESKQRRHNQCLEGRRRNERSVTALIGAWNWSRFVGTADKGGGYWLLFLNQQ